MTVCSGAVGTVDGRGEIFMHPEAKDWLAKRGLNSELAEKMGLESGPAKDGSMWLKIPFIRDGNVVTNQYRKLDEKQFRFDKGSEAELWNVDVLSDESLQGHPLVITEGVFDGLAALQCGFKKVISVPGWSEGNKDHGKRYDPFKRHEDKIKNAGIIIAAVDADNTGRSLLYAIDNFFEECDVCYVSWPDDCKDCNDVLQRHGADAVTDAINGARSLDPQGGLITGFSDLPPRPERRMWKVGDPQIDTVFAVRTREISVLTGLPGAGKTTMITWLMDRLVKKHGVRVGLALFETDAEEIFDQLVRLKTIHSGLKKAAQLSKAEREFSAQQFDQNWRIIHRVEDEDQTPHGMLWLKQMIHKCAARDGCDIIVIDPWNELEHMLEPGDTMTNYINFALMRLRQWADKYDIHICVVAHPRKMEPGQEPTGYSVADSAAFFNKPGMGWTVHCHYPKPVTIDGEVRLPEPPFVSLRAWKVRSRQETGCKPCFIKLNFDEDEMSYTPISFPKEGEVFKKRGVDNANSSIPGSASLSDRSSPSITNRTNRDSADNLPF